ncbi:hypothetical protein [Microbacterium sp. G2-8]|uniref:hypothetical protein n=1 Tax=Microbacterium sp. G2-8 TaxID=2842454 RepID=UPI001C8A7225|nr:hypothetical protein [Microbacterium sp. G2-8]
MTIFRLALALIGLVALAASAATGRYDGAWLLGLIAALLLLATFGLFSRETWSREDPRS